MARFDQEVLGPGARWRDGVAEADGNVYDLAELARLYRVRHAGDVLEARASYTPDTDFPDKSFYGNPSPAYPFAAHVAEVAIDLVPAAVANAIAHARRPREGVAAHWRSSLACAAGRRACSSARPRTGSARG
ncbi:molybdopterin-dependent oxidoreductase [Alicyclobacillus macrosporangiidus]|uniref:molybdopterin-dependent oxidoreductase n=1 Tax=Alicyclobacillus macrosporangiidus TaxID=392015 RepID=UPI000945B180|nr:molybdopterin-dependent oxidoreductase [Alicyclobacillus macrosporangiidus]